MKTEEFLTQTANFLTSRFDLSKTEALAATQVWLERLERQNKPAPPPKARISTSLNLEAGRITIQATNSVSDEGNVLLETFIMDRKIKGAWRIIQTEDLGESGWRYRAERYAKVAKPKISQATIEKKVGKMAKAEQLALLTALETMLKKNIKAK